MLFWVGGSIKQVVWNYQQGDPIDGRPAILINFIYTIVHMSFLRGRDRFDHDRQFSNVPGTVCCCFHLSHWQWSSQHPDKYPDDRGRILQDHHRLGSFLVFYRSFSRGLYMSPSGPEAWTSQGLYALCRGNGNGRFNARALTFTAFMECSQIHMWRYGFRSVCRR